MKILVFSDSHRRTIHMVAAIQLHQPDTVIHLGDLMDDTQELRHIYPRLPLVCVPGNCDGWTDEPTQKLIDFWGKKILLSHGHLWRVKQGYHGAIHAGHQAEADILLFGHTHVPYCEKLDGLWVMNPGASSHSFGIIELDGDNICCSLHPSDD